MFKFFVCKALMLVYILPLLLLTGCNPKQYPIEPEENNGTLLRIINNLYLNKNIDVYIDNVLRKSTLNKNSCTEYLSVNSGLRQIKINESGTSNTLLSGNVQIDSGKAKALTIFGDPAIPKYYDFLITNNYSFPDKFALQLINLLSNTLTIDISIKNNNSTQVINSLSVSSGTGYLDFTPGNTVITIKNSLNKKLLVTNSFIFSAKKSFTIFINQSGSLSTDSSNIFLNLMEDTKNSPQTLLNLAEGISKIRFINNNFNSASVDFWIDTQKVAGNISLLQNSDFFYISKGIKRIRAISGNGLIFADTVIQLNENKSYSFTTYSVSNINLLLFYEITPPVQSNNKSYIRFINISSSEIVNIKISSSAGDNFANNLSSGSGTSYFELIKGTINLTLSDNSSELFSSEFNTTNGSLFSIFVSGNKNDTGKKEISFYYISDSDTAEQIYRKSDIKKSSLRFANFLSDSIKYDFYVDDSPIFTNSLYKDISSKYGINKGLRKFNIKRTGNSASFKEFNYELKLDKDYLIFLGKKNNQNDYFLIESGVKNIVAGKTTIRFINALYNNLKTTISVKNSSQTLSLDALPNGETTNYFDLTTGSNEINIKLTDTDELILSNVVNLSASEITTFIILGDNTNGYSLNYMNDLNLSGQKLQTLALPGSSVRFINCSYDSPKLDLIIGSNTTILGMDYKSASKQTNVSSGNQTVKLKENSGSNIIKQINHAFVPNKKYYAVTSGKISNADLNIFETPNKTSPTGGNSIRFINLAEGINSVDISITNTAGQINLTGLQFKSSTPYYDLAFQYNEIIIKAGSSENNIITTASATFETEKVYTVFILSKPGVSQNIQYSMDFIEDSNIQEQTLFSFLLLDYSWIRFIHASPNSSGYDIAYDNNTISNLFYTVSSGYKYIRSNSRNIRIFRSGNSSNIFNFDYTFIKNKYYTFILTDSVSKISYQMIEDNNITFEDGKSYIRFLNHSPDSAPFDIKIGNAFSPAKYSNFQYRQLTGYEKYEPGIYSFIITETGKSNEITSIKSFTLNPNRVYSFIIMGFKNGPTGQQIELKWYPDK